jgi:hypothetical protein
VAAGSSLRRAVRRLCNRAGYQIARLPSDHALASSALPSQTIDPVGTHVAPLAAAVAATEWPVLELGMGDHSTPLLHLLCARRLLVSGDTSAAWVGRYERFRSATHELHVVGEWRRFDVLEREHWAVAFVDAAPAHARVDLVERLRGRATFIVVHDTEPDTEAAAVYALDGTLGRSRYRSDYRVFRPFTTIVSDERPFELTAAELG